MVPTLFQFLYRETDGYKFRLTVVSLAAGLSRGGLLIIIARAASAISAESGNDFKLLFGMAATLAMYLIMTYFTSLTGRRLVETISNRLRYRLLDKLLRGPLRLVETIGFGELHAHLNADLARLTSATVAFTGGLQAGVVVTVALAFLGWLTPLGLLATLLTIGAGAMTYLWQDKHATNEFERAREKAGELARTMDEAMHGFKEVKQNRVRHTDLMSHVTTVAEELCDLNLKSEARSLRSNLTAETYMYGMIAILIFALPVITKTERTAIFEFLATVLFIMGPVGQLISSIPTFSVAAVALRNVQRLESVMDRELELHGEHDVPVLPKFQRITMENVNFRFVGKTEDESFAVGPIDLELTQGEVLFIVGGNGAGKTTLLKLMMGLYSPDSGRMLVDGEPIERANAQAYREMFAAVFSDFHLFRRLYGIAPDEPAAIDRLLAHVGIDTKTRLVDKGFTTIQLSSGQRKRLAYVVARLADRQIYVFDEFAADQDPRFREFFYHVLLPELRQQGKTVVAVSHDDRYFHVADRLVKLDYGQIVKVNEASPLATHSRSAP